MVTHIGKKAWFGDDFGAAVGPGAHTHSHWLTVTILVIVLLALLTAALGQVLVGPRTQPGPGAVPGTLQAQIQADRLPVANPKLRLDPRIVVTKDAGIDPGILVQKDARIDPRIFAFGMPPGEGSTDPITLPRIVPIPGQPSGPVPILPGRAGSGK